MPYSTSDLTRNSKGIDPTELTNFRTTRNNILTRLNVTSQEIINYSKTNDGAIHPALIYLMTV